MAEPHPLRTFDGLLQRIRAVQPRAGGLQPDQLVAARLRLVVEIDAEFTALENELAQARQQLVNDEAAALRIGREVAYNHAIIENRAQQIAAVQGNMTTLRQRLGEHLTRIRDQNVARDLEEQAELNHEIGLMNAYNP